jgi:PAS domain-containing protein
MRITDIRPPEDVSALMADVARERTPLQQSGRWRHRLKSGEMTEVEISSHTLRFADRPAALVVAHDVTARLRAERSLTESEARKAAMLEAALDAVVAIDEEGRISDFNPAAERTVAPTSSAGRSSRRSSRRTSGIGTGEASRAT